MYHPPYSTAKATVFASCPELVRYIDDFLDAMPDFLTGIERLEWQLQTSSDYNFKLKA